MFFFVLERKRKKKC